MVGVKHTAINAPNNAALLVTVFAPLLGSSPSADPDGSGLVAGLVPLVAPAVEFCAAVRERSDSSTSRQSSRLEDAERDMVDGVLRVGSSRGEAIDD